MHRDFVHNVVFIVKPGLEIKIPKNNTTSPHMRYLDHTHLQFVGILGCMKAHLWLLIMLVMRPNSRRKSRWCVQVA
jgi:hypothetical protein